MGNPRLLEKDCPILEAVLANPQFEIIPIPEDTEEFAYVKARMFTWTDEVEVLSVVSIKNDFLRTKFDEKLLEKERIYGTKPKIQQLFHGTLPDNIDLIAKYNLDWRLNQDHLHGYGVYFARHPRYALYFPQEHKGADKCVIIFEVITAKIQKLDSYNGHVFYPDPPNDTIEIHDEKHYGILLKFEDNEFLPRYVVSCRIHLKKQETSPIKEE